MLKNTRTGNEISLWLAPGIGLVKTINSRFPNETILIKARINDVRIPSKIISPKLELSQPLYRLGPAIQLTSSFPMNDEFDSNDIKIISKKRGPLNCRYSVYFKSITIEPEYGFTFNDSVTVYVSGNLTDIMGDSLDQDYVFTFSTENDMIPGDLFIKDDRSKIPIFIEGDFDLGDYDNDGDKDLLVIGSRQYYVSDYAPEGYLKRIELYKNVSGVFTAEPLNIVPIYYGLELPANSIKWVDFNSDGWLDFVYSGQDSNHQGRTYFYENRNSQFVLRDDIIINIGPASMSWYDFNNDGYPELIIKDKSLNGSGTNNGTSIFNNESGILSLDTVLTDATEILADFNQDGQMDILGYVDGSLIIYQNNNRSFFRNTYKINNYVSLQFDHNRDVQFADIDNDGDIDLLIGRSTLLYEQGSFTQKQLFPTPALLNSFVRFFDYDHDNINDLFFIGTYISSSLGFSSFLNIYEYEEGSFKEVREILFYIELFISSIKWQDLNNDSKADLIIMSRYGFLIYYNAMNTIDLAKQIDETPQHFSLSQNYPNPFNPATTIAFSIPEPGKVSLKLYDMLGREVFTLLNEEMPAGNHNIELNASSLSSGTYIYKLTAGKHQLSRKLVLLK